ncbi:MAG: glutamate--tRNA ligase [Candidatus Nomurabacteria bacterium]|jgi:glutamyl-tRNA synthetase|nr:glutamate--tRNA ligase [Candidatus Nomurabacteria bacterium]
MTVRTRFAPSPTGFLHVGGVRTALYAYLVTQKAKLDGDPDAAFVLRLEDTDQKREVAGAADHIMKSLGALGLNYDEGPDIGGKFGSYIQSKRLEIYHRWAEKLVQDGRAYADPYTPTEIQSFREAAQKAKQPFLYRDRRPTDPPRWDGSRPLRFKSEPKAYHWHDAVMGNLHAGADAVDDFILIKSDGFPTYNFAHIVDDFEMKISHIIRGQEFIASMPNYLNLYEALQIAPPIFATMPHILAAQGNKKLSKRDGAKDVLDYLRDGFLREALVNFIASLGWNDGSEQEIFSMGELIRKFSLDRVQKSGARFDEKRLTWLNGQWIRRLNLNELTERCNSFWGENGAAAEPDFRRQVLRVVQPRLKTLADLPALSEYFFARPTPNWPLALTAKPLKKIPPDQLKTWLKTARDKLANLSEQDFQNEELLQTNLNELLTETGQKPAVIFSLIRFALTWAPFSPGLPETLRLLGKSENLARLDAAILSND